MKLSEYSKFDTIGLAELVRKNEVTAKELAQLALQGVIKVNPSLNAVIEVFLDRVYQLYENSLPDGPFKGVPLFLKDTRSAVKGRKKEYGSRLLKGYVADKDTFLTLKFLGAGLNIIGRTTVPEFGNAFTTQSVLQGATANPWNPGLTPGGSSGGSAAIVAAGVVPAAHANDGGGSIRIPASYCGLVGLKASRGRISKGPGTGDYDSPQVTEGVLTRTVRDTAAFLDIMQGPGIGDPYIILQPKRPFLSEVGAPAGSLRIGVSFEPWGPNKLDPEIERELSKTAQLCEQLGHQVFEVRTRLNYEMYVQTELLLSYRFPPQLESSARMMGREISEETVEPVNLKYYEYGRKSQYHPLNGWYCDCS